MAAFVIFDVEVLDKEKFENYKQMVPLSLPPYGGRFAVRAGKLEVLEGDWTPGRFGIIEFPSVERAKAWYNSPEYAPAKALRLETARARIFIVEGVSN